MKHDTAVKHEEGLPVWRGREKKIYLRKKKRRKEGGREGRERIQPQ
jgi:hypothetical protein